MCAGILNDEYRQMIDTVFGLFAHFCLLSFFAVGGALAMVADMHRFLVIEQHLMTSQQ